MNILKRLRLNAKTAASTYSDGWNVALKNYELWKTEVRKHSPKAKMLKREKVSTSL